MRDSVKKSFLVVKDNPLITLTFVIYLIILFTAVQAVLISHNKILTVVLGILILLLTGAFLAGWFGMIKTGIICFKENKTIEEKVEDLSKLKNSFFNSVYDYLAPVTAGLIMLIAAAMLIAYLSYHLFYKLNDVINQLNTLYVQQGSFNEYLMSLPEGTKIMVAKKMIFSILTTGLLQFISILYAASLYFNKENSKNPLKNIVYTFSAILHMPVTSILTFVAMTCIYFFLTVIQTSFSDNIIVSFISMIAGIYFAAYIVVLIFDLYDNNITHHSNNRTDCIGQDESGNTNSN